MSMKEIVRHKEREPQRTLVRAATRGFAYEIGAQGKVNLQEERRLINRGKKLVIMPNHLSNADFSIIMLSLRSNGYKEIADNTVPLWGKRLKDNIITNFLSAAYNRIPVWPPTINPAREERQDFVSMNRKAREEAKTVLDSGGHLLIFPEGTRSRSGKMQRGQPGVVHFLTLTPDTFILPIGVFGTEKILPPGMPVPIPSVPNVVYGEPFSVAETIALYKNLKNREQQEKVINHIMTRIASLVPAQYRGVYA